MPAKDITLYAKWNIITYSINYELDGGFTSGNPTAYTVDTNTITLTIPTKEGYTFDGWYLEPEFVTVKTQIIKGTVGNLTLYAKWTLNSYTLSFNSNGGSSVTAITQDYATTVSKPTDPTKVGYTFAGWYSNSSLTTAYIFTTMPAEDITLYAKWNIITYNINYELAAGLNHLSNPSSYTIETNTIILSAPTKEGYTLEGWYSDSNFTNYVSEITIGSIGNLTLYAKWNINSYTAYYNIQSDNQYLLVDNLLLPGETIIQVSLGNSHSAALTSSGRLFTWGNNGDGQLGDGTYSNRTTPTEITSQFSLSTGDKIISVSLGHYHSAALTSSGRLFTWGNNGDGQLGDGTKTDRYSPTQITQAHYELLHSDTVIYNQSIMEYVPLRDGYTFSGWYSDINLNTPYIFGSMPAEDITLHGKWVSND